MKSARIAVIFILLLVLAISLPLGVMGAYADAQNDFSCADFYVPSTKNYKVEASGGTFTLTELPNNGGIRFSFVNSTNSDYRTRLDGITYKLDGMHFSVRNFSGEGFVFSLNSDLVNSARSQKRITVQIRNEDGNTAFRYRSKMWPTLTWEHDQTVTGEILQDFDIYFKKVSGGYNMSFYNTVSSNPVHVVFMADANIAEGITDPEKTILQFHAWTNAGGLPPVANYTFDLVAVHGGENFCIQSMTEQQKEVYSMIEDLASTTITLDSLSAIQAVEAAYNSLSEVEKAGIPNSYKLERARQAYTILSGLSSSEQFDEDNIILTFAAVTDTHIYSGFAEDMATLLKYAPDGIDALVSAGDITQNVYLDTSESGKYDNEIYTAKNKYQSAVDSSVPIFIALGNHDSQGGSNSAKFYDIMGERFFMADLPDSLSFARTSGNRHAVINGIHFLAIEPNYVYSGQNYGYSAETLQWFENEMESIVNSQYYDDKPIFVVTHLPPNREIYGNDATTGLDRILSNYPQSVVLSGHTHRNIVNERSIMQTGYTALHLGVLEYLILDNYLETDSRRFSVDTGEQAYGMIFEMDQSGCIRIKRIDLTQDAVIGEPWIIPSPQSENHLLYYSSLRGEITQPPQFPQSAAIEAKKYNRGANIDTLSLTFPHARGDAVVTHYLIELIPQGQTIPSKTYTSLSGYYKYPNEDYWPEKHYVNIEGLTGTYTVRVTPFDCWDNSGQPISITINANTPVLQETLPQLKTSDFSVSDFDDVWNTGAVFYQENEGINITTTADSIRVSYKNIVDISDLNIVLTNVGNSFNRTNFVQFTIGKYGDIYGSDARGVRFELSGYNNQVRLVIHKASEYLSLFHIPPQNIYYYGVLEGFSGGLPKTLDIHIYRDGDVYKVSVNGVIIELEASVIDSVLPSKTYVNFGAYGSKNSYTINFIGQSALKTNAEIEAAKSAIEGAPFVAAQQDINGSAAAKAYVEEVIGQLLLSNVNVTVIEGDFTPAASGTESNPDGFEGAFKFTVRLEKNGTSAETEELTLIITPDEYDGDNGEDEGDGKETVNKGCKSEIAIVLCLNFGILAMSYFAIKIKKGKKKEEII